MATVKLLSDDELSSEARAVFDDIRYKIFGAAFDLDAHRAGRARRGR